MRGLTTATASVGPPLRQRERIIDESVVSSRVRGRHVSVHGIICRVTRSGEFVANQDTPP